MILCCGEALIDMIPTPTRNGSDGFVPHSGGAVFNTAIALGRLGQRTAMLTGLSSDMFGQQLTQALHDSGVDASLAITSDRPTTLAFVSLKNGQARYSFFDENSAGRMIRPDDLPAIPDDVALLYFGGISLACEPGAAAYEQLAICEGHSKSIMIDPNIRPNFIEDPTAYRARLERMIAVADIVKLSDEDLDWIISDQRPRAEKMKQLLRAGPSVVVMTEGAKGATAYTSSGHTITVAAPNVSVVDTVGAGDTMSAGFLARLSQLGRLSKSSIAALTKDHLKDTLAYGVRVAAITVSRAGANPPWASELDS